MGLKEEEMMERMTRLLEQGCTMLATHHSCGAPLFRCKGKVVCPVCSFEDKANSKISEPPKGASGEGLDQPKRPAEKDAPTSRIEGGVAQADEEIHRRIRELKDALEISLLRRLRELSERVDQEQDPENLLRVLECIDSLLRVLRSLERAD
jgi:UPF0148 protein